MKIYFPTLFPSPYLLDKVTEREQNAAKKAWTNSKKMAVILSTTPQNNICNCLLFDLLNTFSIECVMPKEIRAWEGRKKRIKYEYLKCRKKRLSLSYVAVLRAFWSLSRSIHLHQKFARVKCFFFFLGKLKNKKFKPLTRIFFLF